MQLLNTSGRYGAVAMTIHWLMVALVACAWLLEQFGDLLAKGRPREIALAAHMMLGLAILIALIFRFVWREYDRLPAPAATPLGKALDRLATGVHWFLYLLLAAVPIAGIVLQFALGGAVPAFGLFTISSSWAADRQFAGLMREVHELLANLLVIVAVLHGGMALIHHWYFRDRTLKRMLPNL